MATVEPTTSERIELNSLAGEAPTHMPAQDGRPKFRLADGIILPYIDHTSLELPEPLENDSYYDVRTVDSQTNTHFVNSKSFSNDRPLCENLWTTEHKKSAAIWNWGKEVGSADAPPQNPQTKADHFKSNEPWRLPICESLIRVLHYTLYGDRFHDTHIKSSLFQYLRAQADGFLNHILIRLDNQQLFETGRPISHIIVDVIACILFLKKRANDENDIMRSDAQICEIWNLQEQFWRDKLDFVDPVWVTINWDNYSGLLSQQVNCTFQEVRNILLLDPNQDLKWWNGSVRQPYFRAWADDQKLRKHSFMRSALAPTFRGDLFNSAGIKPGEVNPKEAAKANLADFRATVILKGAFKLALTSDPSLHLRFDETNFPQPTLMILDSRTISNLALLDLTGFMAEVGLPTFLYELIRSHSLFFGRSTPSNNTMESRFKGVDMDIVRDYSQHWSENISAVHINDFPIYGTRLQSIHQRMTDWRPLRLDHSFRYRPYRDSLPVYVFRFALLLGFVTVAGLVLNTYAVVSSKKH